MTNEEQLREEWEEYQPELNEKYLDEVKGSADWWLRKLHQAELNWITEQIERGEELVDIIKNIQAYSPDGEIGTLCEHALYNLSHLTPLIERKRELEEIIGKEEQP